MLSCPGTSSAEYDELLTAFRVEVVGDYVRVRDHQRLALVFDYEPGSHEAPGRTPARGRPGRVGGPDTDDRGPGAFDEVGQVFESVRRQGDRDAGQDGQQSVKTEQ